MQVFDYHINPKLKRDLVFKSFYFQPEIKEEKNLGRLCIVIEMSNSLLRDSKIISNLASDIKEEFFSEPSRNPETALKQALKKGNKYLEKLTQEGNVRWLGNLNLAVISIKDSIINFSKAGNIKLLLLRGNEYHDIGENLEFQNTSSSQLNQPFSNIASGRLSETDKVIILTQDIFDFFHLNLAEKIAVLADLTPKTLSKILGKQKKDMEKISGIFFLIFMEQKRHKRLPLLKIKFPFIKIKKEIFLIIALILILLLSYLIFR
jgi:hypothetical protein